MPTGTVNRPRQAHICSADLDFKQHLEMIQMQDFRVEADRIVEYAQENSYLRRSGRRRARTCPLCRGRGEGEYSRIQGQWPGCRGRDRCRWWRWILDCSVAPPCHRCLLPAGIIEHCRWMLTVEVHQGVARRDQISHTHELGK